MRCEGCARPERGTYIAGCRQCALRNMARGPAFFASARAGKITPAYAAQLQVLGRVEDVHAEAKAMAKRLVAVDKSA